MLSWYPLMHSKYYLEIFIIHLSKCQFVYKICKEFLLPIPYHGCWNILSTVSKEFLLPSLLSWLKILWIAWFWSGGWQDNNQDMLLCIISAISWQVDALFVSINRWGAWIPSAALYIWPFLWKWFVYQPILWFHYQCFLTGVDQCKPSLHSSQCGSEEKFTMFDSGVTQCLDIWLCRPIFTALHWRKMSNCCDVLCIPYDCNSISS